MIAGRLKKVTKLLRLGRYPVSAEVLMQDGIERLLQGVGVSYAGNIT